MPLISKQKYDAEQLQKLSQLVRMYHQKEQPFDYEIIVDGLKVVRRTNNPERFFEFENFIDGSTKTLEVLFYTGASNVNERRMFTFTDEPEQKGLSGIDVDARIQEQVEKERKGWQFDLLTKENKELKEDVEELEKEIAQLEKEKEALLNNNSPLKGLLGEVGSSFVESFIRRNPKIVKSIPGGEMLAGLLEQDSPSEEVNSPESEVTFAPRTDLSEDAKYAIQFVDQLKSQFTREEFDKVLIVLERMAHDKSRIDAILNHSKNQSS